MATPLNVLSGLCLLVVVLVAQGRRWRNSRAANPHGLPLPPGPPTLPLIGNLLDMPKEQPWLHYNALTRKYGMLMCF